MKRRLVITVLMTAVAITSAARLVAGTCTENPEGRMVCPHGFVAEPADPNAEPNGLTLQSNAGNLGPVPPPAVDGDLWLGSCGTDQNAEYCFRLPDNSTIDIAHLVEQNGITDGYVPYSQSDGLENSPLYCVPDYGGMCLLGSDTTPYPGTSVQVVSEDGYMSGLFAWAYGGPVVIGFASANGTAESPEAVTGGDRGGFKVLFHDGEGWNAADPFESLPTEDWSPTNHGYGTSLMGCVNGGTDRRSFLKIAGEHPGVLLPANTLFDTSPADPNAGDYGIKLATSTGCSKAIGTGKLCWDGSNLYVGDGTDAVRIGGKTP